jgi:triosephosphate isomerase
VCLARRSKQREKNIEKEIILSQIQKAFEAVTKEDAVKVIVAYEPIWAIGTGKTATDDQANQMCAYI